ncbi:PKD domain-containing protein, partial [bacterium]|nr:PKD domain-containing protein [bacterium]
HDTWPYAQDKDNERDRYSSIAGCAIGDQLFKEVFWGEANNDNKVLIDNLFGDSWDHMYNEPVPLNAGALECGCYDFTLQTDDGKYFEKDEKECNSETTDYYLQNYGFTYNGITFICLDQVPRLGEDREPWNGNALPGAFIKGLFATDHEQTVDFSRKHYEAYPSETAVLFSHYPTHPESIDNYLLTPRQRWLSSSDSPEYAYWFAGHVHYHKDSLGVKRRVIETEDVAGIPFYLLGVPVETIMLGERNGKTIRIVQIDDGELDYSTVLKPMREVAIKWPRPLLEIIWPFKSLPEPGTEITFTARCASYYGFSTSFDWNFGDGNTSSSLWPSVTHGYSVEGDYDVTVTVTTKNLTTGEETTHSTTRTVCVRNKHIISPLPVSVRATSFFTGQDLSQVPKNTYEPVLISKEASEETLIAGLGFDAFLPST